MSAPYEQEAGAYVERLRTEIDAHPFTSPRMKRNVFDRPGYQRTEFECLDCGTSAFHMVVLFDRLRALLERTNRETAAWAGVKNDVY